MNSKTWLTATSVSALAPGEMVGIELGGAQIAVYNVEGVFYATSNICTHAFTFLTEGWLSGHIIECPLHGGQFDLTTGKGLGAPITCDIETFPTRVVGDEVQVMLA